MGHLFICCQLLLVLVAAALEVTVAPESYFLQVKEETIAAERTRKELARGYLSPQTLQRLTVAINSMKRSGDERLVEAAYELEDGHIDFKELQDYVADKVARRAQGAYSTILYFLDYAQRVHPVPWRA